MPVAAETATEYPTVQREVDESSELSIQRQTEAEVTDTVEPAAEEERIVSPSLPEKPLADIHRRPLGQQWFDKANEFSKVRSPSEDVFTPAPSNEQPIIQLVTDDPQESTIQRREESDIDTPRDGTIDNVPTPTQEIETSPPAPSKSIFRRLVEQWLPPKQQNRRAPSKDAPQTETTAQSPTTQQPQPVGDQTPQLPIQKRDEETTEVQSLPTPTAEESTSLPEDSSIRRSPTTESILEVPAAQPEPVSVETEQNSLKDGTTTAQQQSGFPVPEAIEPVTVQRLTESISHDESQIGESSITTDIEQPTTNLETADSDRPTAISPETVIRRHSVEPINESLTQIESLSSETIQAKQLSLTESETSYTSTAPQFPSETSSEIVQPKVDLPVSEPWQTQFDFGAEQATTQPVEAWQHQFDLGELSDLQTEPEVTTEIPQELPQLSSNISLPESDTSIESAAPAPQTPPIPESGQQTNVQDEDLELLVPILYSLLRSRLEQEQETINGYATHPPPWLHCLPNLNLDQSSLKQPGQSFTEIDANTFLLDKKIQELFRAIYPIIQHKMLLEKER